LLIITSYLRDISIANRHTEIRPHSTYHLITAHHK